MGRAQEADPSLRSGSNTMENTDRAAGNFVTRALKTLVSVPTAGLTVSCLVSGPRRMLTSADRVPIWGSAEPRGSDSRQSSGPSLTYLCSNMPPTTSTNPPVIPNRRHSRNPKSDLWCACLPVSGVSRACGAGAADPRPSLSSGMCEPHGGLQGRGPRPAGSARESKQLVSSGGGGVGSSFTVPCGLGLQATWAPGEHFWSPVW